MRESEGEASVRWKEGMEDNDWVVEWSRLGLIQLRFGFFTKFGEYNEDTHTVSVSVSGTVKR